MSSSISQPTEPPPVAPAFDGPRTGVRSSSRSTAEAPIPHHLFEWEGDLLWATHCSVGPVPVASALAMIEVLARETRPWAMRWEEDFQGIPDRTRQAAAELIGARSEDISLTPTTSTALTTIAHAMPWRPGDEVVTPLGEFPTNVWPWRALAGHGVSWREVPLWDGQTAGEEAWVSPPPLADVDPEERLLSALGPRTRILAVSWVRFQDGLTLDLERLGEGCRERGVDLIVDGIQGIGTEPLDVSHLPGVSAVACGGHKGLLAPQGQGFLWTSAALRQRLLPVGSWLSVESATDFDRPSTDFDRDWLGDGRCFELGVPNLLGCAALEASLRLLVDTGVERIAANIASCQEELLRALEASRRWPHEIERLQALRARGRVASILAIHHQDQGSAHLAELVEKGLELEIHASVREGYLRIALHGWHVAADAARLARWLVENW